MTRDQIINKSIRCSLTAKHAAGKCVARARSSAASVRCTMIARHHSLLIPTSRCGFAVQAAVAAL